MPDRIGFFEEDEGVSSMTRLAIFWLLVLATGLVAAIIAYALRGKPDAGVLGALGVALSAVVLHGAVAIKNRNGPIDDK